MGTAKDDSIKFRVSKELKNDFKAYTERNNTNMSEIFTGVMIELLEREKFKLEYQKQICDRSAETEIKIAKVKARKFSCENTKKKFMGVFSFFKRFK